MDELRKKVAEFVQHPRGNKWWAADLIIQAVRDAGWAPPLDNLHERFQKKLAIAKEHQKEKGDPITRASAIIDIPEEPPVKTHLCITRPATMEEINFVDSYLCLPSNQAQG